MFPVKDLEDLTTFVYLTYGNFASSLESLPKSNLLEKIRNQKGLPTVKGSNCTYFQKKTVLHTSSTARCILSENLSDSSNTIRTSRDHHGRSDAIKRLERTCSRTNTNHCLFVTSSNHRPCLIQHSIHSTFPLETRMTLPLITMEPAMLKAMHDISD